MLKYRNCVAIKILKTSEIQGIFMKNSNELKIIAHIHNDFTEKFGIPRQSGLVDTLQSKIVFTPEYRNKDSLRGLDEYTHIWLLWIFSKAVNKEWSPTVRPPRLGGNKRVGVFASRSPFRPNSIGLSSVKIEKIDLNSPLGPVIYVSGADILNNTPIIDIKPYLPYTDCHSDAGNGFAYSKKGGALQVDFPTELLNIIPKEKQNTIIDILAQDPRPGYQSEQNRIYKMAFGGFEIHFSVLENTLKVHSVFSSENNLNNA